VYGAVLHYLKAVDATGSDEGTTVVGSMRKIPINDFYTKNGSIREDGRVLRNMYLLQVKEPNESKYTWDYYKVLETVPGDKAFRPMALGGCPLVNAAK